MKRLVLPALMSAMYLGQAAVCYAQGDIKRAGYWLACIAITWFAA